MDAKTLNCPSCGGSISADSTRCKYCGALLATVSCPKCFGMAFVGSRFCPHCGAALAEAPTEGTSILCCPRCRGYMQQRILQSTTITQCDKCGGLWIDAATFQRICADRETQSSVLGSMLGPDERVTVDPSPRYLPCPRCNQLMNRLNFAHYSGVIIDICKPHGIWFDKDELRRIVEFILAGGMDRARMHEMDEIQSKQREFEAAKRVQQFTDDSPSPVSSFSEQDLHSACRLAGVLLGKVLH
jgi:Zn-finger nucleic acid-binding protein